MTLFVFFARTTGTRVVSTNFRFRLHGLLHGFTCHAGDSHDVVSVHLDAGHAVGRGPVGGTDLPLVPREIGSPGRHVGHLPGAVDRRRGRRERRTGHGRVEARTARPDRARTRGLRAEVEGGVGDARHEFLFDHGRERLPRQLLLFPSFGWTKASRQSRFGWKTSKKCLAETVDGLNAKARAARIEHPGEQVARVIAAVMGAAARRPVVVGASVLVLALAGAGLALRLEPSAQTSTVVGTSTCRRASPASAPEAASATACASSCSEVRSSLPSNQRPRYVRSWSSWKRASTWK